MRRQEGRAKANGSTKFTADLELPGLLHVQLVLSHPRLALARTATLSAEEARLLAGHPAGAWALREDAGASEAQPVVSVRTRTP